MNKNLQAAIDEHNIITFDVYDTLLKRMVSNDRDIWKLVDIEWIKRFGEKNFNFYEERIKADRIARKSFSYKEVNLDEIYNSLSKIIGIDNANKCKALELEFEHTLVMPNKEIVKAFQYAISTGKAVYIISDMYLRQNDIDMALQHIGVSGYKKLFVSCEYRVTKHETGALYKTIIDEIDIKPSEILHIGNDKNADINKAKIQGLDTYWVQETDEHFYINSNSTNSSLESSILSGFIKKYSKSIHELSYKLGFEVFGPILTGFLTWLETQKSKNNLDKIIFLARDGYVLNSICKEAHILGDVEYFYLSRRSMVIPMIQYQDSLADILALYKSWPVKSSATILFDKLGIDEDLDLLSQFGIDISEEFTKNALLNDNRINCFFNHIKNIIYKNSQEQSLLLNQYLKELGTGIKIGIVDLGSGTIFSSLNKYCELNDINIEWIPLFFQSSLFPNKSFLNTDDNSDYKNILRFGYMFLEIFFTAPHGTTKGYYSSNGNVRPLLSDYEYERLDDTYKNRLLNLHRGAIDFYKEFSSVMKKFDINSIDTIFNNYSYFVINPTGEDINYWKDYPFYTDSFQFLIPQRKKLSYLKSPSLFKTDYKQALWLSGFLKYLTKSNSMTHVLFSLYKLLNRRG